MHRGETDAAGGAHVGNAGDYCQPEESRDAPPNALALVARAQAGDDEAARLLVEQLYPLVLKLVRSYRSRRTAEEDLCQVIFLQIFKNLKQFSRQVPLEHWVSRIAINTCLKQLEAERIRPEIRYADLSEEQINLVSGLASAAWEKPEHEKNAAREIVEYLMTGLEPKEKLIIMMMHLEERTLEEIKALTGWSSPVIRVRAFRARRKLRRLYLTMKTKEF